MAKTLFNTAAFSTVAALLILNDKDGLQEQYDMLSDYMKKNNVILPNPIRHIDKGSPSFIRIPMAQDALGYAVHGLVTNMIWGVATGKEAMGTDATLSAMWDVLNPINGTVFQPFIDSSHHRTWWGGNTIRSSQQDWADPSVQYNEDTAQLFRDIGRLIGKSPEDVEYIFKQMTGYVGQAIIPAISFDKNGKIGGLPATFNAFGNQWGTDPTRSTDIINDFRGMKASITQVVTSAKNNMPQNLLKRDANVDQAYLEAEKMTAKGGIIYDTNLAINQMYTDVDNIYKNESLTSSEQAALVKERMTETLRLVDHANEELLEYYNKYMRIDSVEDWVSRAQEGKYAHVPTNDERIHQTFKDDADKDYMKMAMEVYNGSGEGSQKEASLPHPSQKFTLTDVTGKEHEIDIPDGDFDEYVNIYKKEYNRAVLKYKGKWATLNDKQKYQALKNAHSAGNKALREWYAKKNGIRIKK